MPARLARALQVNALFRSESSARDKGAASLHIRSCCAINPGSRPAGRGPISRGSCFSGCRWWGGISHEHALYLEGISKANTRELRILSPSLAGPSCHTRTERSVICAGSRGDVLRSLTGANGGNGVCAKLFSRVDRRSERNGPQL